jgi:hypothetical protein
VDETNTGALVQVAELSIKQKAAISREKSRAAAFSKDARGSVNIAGFFKRT